MSVEWERIKKIGEGDAGVIYLVERGGQRAIQKRPSTNTALEAQRQAPQIEAEGILLSALQGMLRDSSKTNKISTPRLLDTSGPGTENGPNYYIIIERARGFSLLVLARIAKVGIDGAKVDRSDLSDEEKLLAATVESAKHVPERIILAALHAILELFAVIHKTPIQTDDKGLKYGVVWNDIKPDHLFWNVENERFTIIDWGNSQYLEEGGATSDGNYSPDTDYRQFLDVMMKYLEENAPRLKQVLRWPARLNMTDEIPALRERIRQTLAEKQTDLHSEQLKYAELLKKSQITKEIAADLQEAQDQIRALGGRPDYEFTLSTLQVIAQTQIEQEAASTTFGRLARMAWKQPGVDKAYWDTLVEIHNLAHEHAAMNVLKPALQVLAAKDRSRSGLQKAFWALSQKVKWNQDSSWWMPASARFRALILGEDGIPPPPYRVLIEIRDHSENPALAQNIDRLLVGWTATPPYQQGVTPGLAYTDVNVFLQAEGGGLDAKERAQLEQALAQPSALAGQALAAWDKGDFKQVCNILRQLLVWDPDWRRVHDVDIAMTEAESWLKKFSDGPKQKSIEQFAREMSATAKGLESRVGMAAKLKRCLQVLEEKSQKPDFLQSITQLVTGLFGSTDSWFKHIPEWVEDGQKQAEDAQRKELDNALREYYTQLARQNPDGAEKIARENILLQPNQKAYSNLAQALDDVAAGSDFYLNEQLGYVPNDPYYKEVRQLVTDLDTWRKLLLSNGVKDARISLNSSVIKIKRSVLSSHPWMQLEYAQQLQSHLETRAETDRKQWMEKLALVQNKWHQGRMSQIGEMRTMLDSLADEFALWHQSIKKTGRPWDKDVLFAQLGDWIKLGNSLKKLQALSVSLLDEQAKWPPKHKRAYDDADLKSARKYMADIIDFEKLLFVDDSSAPGKRLGTSWLSVLNEILADKKSPDKASLHGHPLAVWLENYKPPIDPWILALAMVAVFVAGFFIFALGYTYMQDIGFNQFLPQASPRPKTFQPIEPTRPPHPIPTPIPTSTPDIVRECQDIAGLVQDQTALAELVQNQYDVYREKCNWTYTQEHFLDDITLHDIIQHEVDPARFAQKLDPVHRSLTGSANPLPPNQTMQYAHWLRVTLGLCDLKGAILTISQKKALQGYLPVHLAQYADGPKYFSTICGGQIDPGLLSDVPEQQVELNYQMWESWTGISPDDAPCLSRVLQEDGSDLMHLVYSRSPFERQSDRLCVMSGLPNATQAKEQLASLKVRFAVFSLPAIGGYGYGMYVLRNKSGNALRLERAGNGTEQVVLYQLDGMQMIALQTAPPISRLPRENSHITFEPVFVGNLIIWQIAFDGGQTSVLPILAGVLDEENQSMPLEVGFVPSLEKNDQVLHLVFDKIEILEAQK